MLPVDLQLDDMTRIGESIPGSGQRRLQRHRDRSNAARVLWRYDRLEHGSPKTKLLHRTARRRAPLGERVEHGAVGADSPDDSVTLEATKAVGQQVLRDALQPVLQLLEARGATEQLSKDQNRPAIADDVERRRHRTELPVALAVFGASGGHGEKIKYKLSTFKLIY